MTDQTRLEKVRQALRAGKDLGPLKITVGTNGRMFIDDGRHRIAVLREREFRGRQVEVIFRRGRVRD